MKKLVLLAVAATLSFAVFAQQTPAPADKKQDKKELREDVKKDNADIRNDRKDIRHDVKDLKSDGVKHPLHVVHPRHGVAHL